MTNKQDCHQQSIYVCSIKIMGQRGQYNRITTHFKNPDDFVCIKVSTNFQSISNLVETLMNIKMISIFAVTVVQYFVKYYISIYSCLFRISRNQKIEKYFRSSFGQVLTQEDWNVVLYDGMRSLSAWAALYFIFLMIIGNYILFNLLVAILVEGFADHSVCPKRANSFYNIHMI